MHYILTAGSKGFIKVEDNGELIISPDQNKATRYESVGDAMRAAIDINSALGTHTVKFTSIEE